MLGHRHLHENRLLDCYVAIRHGEALDPREAEHLADCDTCSTRYSDLVAFMSDLETAADAEADEVFTPEWLHAQRQAISRRLEHVGRPARVISFPRTFGSERLQTTAGHSPSRWVAGAAAAGLFIGVALGASFEWQRRATRPETIVVERPVTPSRVMPVATDGVTPGASDIAADDAFLSELEVWADRPRTRELLPVDVLTPHAREIRDSR